MTAAPRAHRWLDAANRPGRRLAAVGTWELEGREGRGSTPGDATSAVAALLPVKAFGAAKRRLSRVLDPAERVELSRSMATTVVAATAGMPTFVVCDDDEVARWARGAGAEVIWRPGRGLNGAVNDGVHQLATWGFDRIVVSHADLPHARDLRWVADFDGVTLVPDRHDDGTNVACVPAGTSFRFAYGRGSFPRHLAEAHRRGLAVRIERDQRLGWDVDVPSDLSAPSFART